MKLNSKALVMAGLAASMLAVAPAAQAGDALSDMLAGKSAMKGKKLEKAIQKADEHPLGSEANPVRAAQPQGQRAYLAKLRCADGNAPQFNRSSNVGVGVFDNIVDAYVVTCAGSEPASSTIFMDMYHAGYVETRAVPGFTIAAP